MWNKVKYYVLRYWVAVSFLLFAFYFYEPTQSITHCSPSTLSSDTPKTFFGLGEMTLMWILMAIAHSSNACYCDIKSLVKKIDLTVVLVEQNAMGALKIADQGIVLNLGSVVLVDSADKLLNDPAVRSAYLGF